MSRLVQKQLKTILDAADSGQVGEVLNVEDFRHIVLEFTPENSPDFTVKFKGAVSDEAPSDFSAAKTSSNVYDFIQVKKLDDGTAIDGSTGITLSGSGDIQLLEVNVNLLKWFTAEITTYTAGNLTVRAKMSGN